MKRWVKWPLRVVWAGTARLRRPFIVRFERMLARCTPAPTVHLQHVCRVTDETALLMDQMLRELVRLQDQVDQLQEAVERVSAPRSGLTVVGSNLGPESVAV